MCIDVSLLVSVKVLEDTSLGSALADSAEAAAIRGSDRRSRAAVVVSQALAGTFCSVHHN